MRGFVEAFSTYNLTWIAANKDSDEKESDEKTDILN